MPAARPNILMITADEWRADALGCAGNPVVRTPNVDALAARGIRFTNAYTPAPMCVPARVSILTGQVPRAHGAMTNGFSPPDNVSIVSLMRDAGYRTAAFGKMHFVPVYHDFGFETMQISEQHGYGWRIDDYHQWLWESHGLVDWIDLWDQVAEFRKAAPRWYTDTYGALPSPLPEEAYHTTWITDRFIDWLGLQGDDRPFFSWVSYIKPHHPFDPPGHYATMYRPEDMPLPVPDDLASKPLLEGFDPHRGHFDISEWTDDDVRRMIALYYGTVTHIDDSVGRILAALEASGRAENTIVIVNSDHGDYLGNRGFITKAPFVPYEDTVRVPFIWYDPRNRANGRTSDAFVSLVDLFPTFAAAAGVRHDHTIHGHDLSGLIRGERDAVTDIAVSENPWSVIAVRKGPWKLIEAGDSGACELYDVVEDPGERRNRYPEMADSPIVADLRNAALRYVLSTGWDRFQRDLSDVKAVVEKEADERCVAMLPVHPEDWRAIWSDSEPKLMH